MACPHQPSCALFTVPAMRQALPLWQSLYCDDDWERCERRKRREAGLPVAQNLLPNGKALSVKVGSAP